MVLGYTTLPGVLHMMDFFLRLTYPKLGTDRRRKESAKELKLCMARTRP